MKTCEICGAAFEERRPQQPTCSRQCAWKWKKQKYGVFWRRKNLKPPVILVCAFCGVDFPKRNKNQRCCSKSCASTLKEREKGNGKVVEVTCLECGTVFSVRLSHLRSYCNQSCVAKNKLKRPEIRAAMYNAEVSRKISERQRAFYRTPAGRKTAKASGDRIRNRTPEMVAAVVQKGRRTKEEKGILHLWPAERGGNGKITPAQAALFSALGNGWVLEQPIPTKVPKGNGYPTCYKVDVGNAALLLAVEVDGRGHGSKGNIWRDAKKTRLLEGLGWSVLRFTNEDVMTRLSWVLSEIKNAASAG